MNYLVCKIGLITSQLIVLAAIIYCLYIMTRSYSKRNEFSHKIKCVFTCVAINSANIVFSSVSAVCSYLLNGIAGGIFPSLTAITLCIYEYTIFGVFKSLVKDIRV